MKHIKVLGRKIKVKFIPQKKLGEIALDQHTVGLYDPNTMTIYLASELSPEQRRYYLIHEAVHASHHFTGIDQTIPDSLVEIICQTTATLFEDLLEK
jgi:Zn-dependent peptidase ImmA (M78 family)